MTTIKTMTFTPTQLPTIEDVLIKLDKISKKLDTIAEDAAALTRKTL